MATQEQTKKAILDLLELVKPVALSAGEVTHSLEAGGLVIPRASVKRHLDNMLAQGEVKGETKQFWRNGGNRTGTAYSSITTTSEQVQAILDSGDDVDPFSGLVPEPEERS